MEESEIHPSSDMLSDLDIFGALTYLSLNKWESKQRFGGPQRKTRSAQEAADCQAMRRKLSSKIESGDVIPLYVEYMDSEKDNIAWVFNDGRMHCLRTCQGGLFLRP